MIDLNYPTWAGDGLCAHLDDINAWFPEPDQSARDAKETCARCPVRQKCLDYALSIEVTQDGRPLGSWSRHGIYGGLTRGERAALALGTQAA